jgi:predicted ATP-grasp superfamily ATP-dependent carboligase
VLDPTQLYQLDVELSASTGEGLQPHQGLEAPVLVHAMAGFVDAGAAGRLAAEHLLENLEHRVLATFDLDQLVDYRSRRPSISFVEDHFEDYAAPTLALYLMRDTAGQPFLFLTGPEPDLQWERFIAAVVGLVERFGVRLTVGLNAIPMAVPHTRPTGVTPHATRPELVLGESPWTGTIQVPASAASLLELRLGLAGRDAAGFAVHVPHYLTQTEYPDAAEALLDAVARATGLALPSAALRSAAERTRSEIDEQVGRSEEVAAVVRALEQQYDAYVGSHSRATLIADRESLPTADEIGADFERFLAEREDGGSSPG